MAEKTLPRVVIMSLASDFGCQVQISNIEDKLLEVLGQFDLTYWQLVARGEMPSEYDVIIVEGAVTTQEHVDFLEKARETAAVVMTVGACAQTAGVVGIATLDGGIESKSKDVYGKATPETMGDRITPRPVKAVIEVDYEVPGCPIDCEEFVHVLQKALLGVSAPVPSETMCGSCRINETECFFDRGEVCLGLVTAAGCGARCVALDRPCKGCRGLASSANLAYAAEILGLRRLDPKDMDNAIELFNAVRETARD